MIIRSNNFVLKLEEILKDKLPTERYNEQEIIVLKIIREWFSNAKFFYHQTSGSTGRPKKLKIGRDKIEISTKATLDLIDPRRAIKTSLLCLDPKHIGGAMVVYRALIAKQDLTLVLPSSNLMKQIGNDCFDLVSMVPMQFQKLTESQMNRFSTILIGGAPIQSMNPNSTAKIYSTFGMTETVSHIALKAIDEDVYHTTGDTVVSQDGNDILSIKGSITEDKWLKTNDVVSVQSDNSFKWIGRRDFIVNSGGIKINPEEIELMLMDKVEGELMIGSLPDEQLGHKLILITNGDKQNIDFSAIEKYKVPKACYFNQKIIKTVSGKIDRLKTQLSFEASL